jgi:putative toxin-antitoxin system antitoxin component (TIGR02293 family)
MPAATLASKATASIYQEIKRIRAGLSFRAVENLQKALDLPAEKLAAVLGMSRATLHRRKLQGRIDPSESERVARYQRLLARATQLFGDAESARQWLRLPQRGLGGAVPIEFAASEIGAREVENLLGRLEFGVYS